jgi:hypothetical protein
MGLVHGALLRSSPSASRRGAVKAGQKELIHAPPTASVMPN